MKNNNVLQDSGNLYVLNYELGEVSGDDLHALAHSLENAIDGHDRLIILPNTMQLRKISTEELIELQMYIDNILESRRGDNE